MSSMAEIITSVYSVLATQSFSAPIFPSDYVGENMGPKFIKFTVTASLSGEDSTHDIFDGFVFFDVYTERGYGPLPAFTIIDELRAVFSRKMFDNRLQFFEGQVIGLGEDPDNSSLIRNQLRINFKYTGAK